MTCDNWALILIIGALAGGFLAMLPVQRRLNRYLLTKQQIVQETHESALAAYKERTKADLASYIPEIVHRRTKAIRQGARFNRLDLANPAHGYVYLMCCNGEYHKIGQAQNVQHRYNSLQGGMPYKLEVVHIIPTEQMTLLEQAMHDRFASKRTSGEWFLLASDEVAYICSIGPMVTMEDLKRQSFWPTVR